MRTLLTFVAILSFLWNPLLSYSQSSTSEELVDLTLITQNLPQKTLTAEEFGSNSFRYDSMTVYSLNVPGQIPAKSIYRVLHFQQFTIGWTGAEASIAFSERDTVYLYLFHHGKMVEFRRNVVSKNAYGIAIAESNSFFPDDEGFIAKSNEASRILYDLKQQCSAY